jgi:pimeloyl-ACP methyl ester carboxylesterase
MTPIYLHGFASSAQSTKGQYLAARFREQGITLQTPDLNQPEFSTLTITRMLQQVTTLIDAAAEDVVLIGSSLGGFVAVQAARARSASAKAAARSRRSAPREGGPGRVSRMVLLAPALDFSANRLRDLGDRGLAEWEQSGELQVFHYGHGRVMPLHYELYRDACQYECASAALRMPILIFQGRRDTAVNPESVEAWAATRPNVELQMLDDDHQLAASLPRIWSETRRFLDIPVNR